MIIGILSHLNTLQSGTRTDIASNQWDDQMFLASPSIPPPPPKKQKIRRAAMFKVIVMNCKNFMKYFL
jgi:hypothetical protein